MKNLFPLHEGTKRIYGLDILRAFAILSVVIHHGRYILPHGLRPFNYLFEFDGVTVFFVLSGFLIGKILIRQFETKQADLHTLKVFWSRRWLRTLPDYFFILILLFVLDLLFTKGFDPSIAYPYFIFSQNIFSPHPKTFFPEAWSLSIEEWFYLTIPLTLILQRKVFNFSVRRSLLLICIIVVTGVTLIRIYRFQNIQPGDVDAFQQLLRKQVITRLDSLMFGIAGAYISYYKHDSWIRYKNILLVAGIVLMIGSRFILTESSYLSWFIACVLSFSLTSLATLLTIPYLSTYKNGSGFIYKVITTISLISYSIYLVNLTLINKWIIPNLAFLNGFQNPLTGMFLKYSFYWIFTIGISILLYSFIEKPFMKMRKKEKRAEFFPAEAQSAEWNKK